MGSSRIIAGLVLLSGLCCGSALATEVVKSRDQASGLVSWEWQHARVKVKLVQRLPDQTRAFFQARGFTSVEADRIARACIFQTIFRNEGQAPVDFDLDDWRLTHAGHRRSLWTRQRWAAFWRKRGTGQAQRIALRWSLLPTRQHFEPGDYNWGMTSFGLPPGERFDLHLKIRVAGEPISGKIARIACATDHP